MKEKKEEKNDGGGGEVAKEASAEEARDPSRTAKAADVSSPGREIYIFYLAAETCAAFFESDERKVSSPFRP